MEGLDELIEQFAKALSNEHTREYYHRITKEVCQAMVRAGIDPIKGDYQSIRMFVREYMDSKYENINSRRTLASGIQTFYEWLIYEGYRTDNPIKNMYKFYPSQPSFRESVPINTAELILHKAYELWEKYGTKHSYDKSLAILILLSEGGLRASELCELKVEHVNPETGVVLIENGKGGKQRVTLINKTSADWLIHVYAVERQLRPFDYLLCTRNRTKLNRVKIYRYIDNVVKHLDLSPKEVAYALSPHRWRHLWLTLHINNGTPVPLIQVMGGWSSINTPLRHYLDVSQITLNNVKLPISGISM